MLDRISEEQEKIFQLGLYGCENLDVCQFCGRRGDDSGAFEDWVQNGVGSVPVGESGGPYAGPYIICDDCFRVGASAGSGLTMDEFLTLIRASPHFPTAK